MHGSEVAKRTTLGRLSHSDEALGRRDDADLRMRAVVPGRGRDHRYQGAEHVSAMTLENRARHPRAVTGGQQRLDDLGIDGNGKRREELVTGGIDEIGPAHVHSARA